MKKGVYIANIVRGQVIEQKALYEALGLGKVAGTAIDAARYLAS